jgi:NAD(P)-dependent dehydrogenase (short-subunit alcohol dehydrogenase family)
MTRAFDPGPHPHGMPRIFCAGVGARMTEVVGEVSDGFFVHPFHTPEFVRETTLPALERGRARSGRAAIMIDTNLKGLLYVTKALLPYLKKSKSPHIINLGSVAAKEVYEKGNVYCASKAAVDAVSQSMRIDMLRLGIKVTAIHPGAAETEFSLVRFKGDIETANKIYDGLKALTAEDVADVVYYTTSLPAHVCINDLVLSCTQQANSIFFNRQ